MLEPLNVPGWIVTHWEQNAYDYRLTIRSLAPSATCPYCVGTLGWLDMAFLPRNFAMFRCRESAVLEGRSSRSSEVFRECREFWKVWEGEIAGIESTLSAAGFASGFADFTVIRGSSVSGTSHSFILRGGLQKDNL